MVLIKDKVQLKSKQVLMGKNFLIKAKDQFKRSKVLESICPCDLLVALENIAAADFAELNRSEWWCVCVPLEDIVGCSEELLLDPPYAYADELSEAVGELIGTLEELKGALDELIGTLEELKGALDEL